MFCPECGEVIGSGPLDVRRAPHVRGDGVAKTPGRWIRALVRRYLGEERRAGQGVLRHGSQSGERDVLRAAGFLGPDYLRVPAAGPHLRDTDAIVSWVYSLSGSAPHLFGERLPQFEAELRALLADASPGGTFADPPTDTEVYIWRNPA